MVLPVDAMPMVVPEDMRLVWSVSLYNCSARLRCLMVMMTMLDPDRAGAVVEGVVVPGLAV